MMRRIHSNFLCPECQSKTHRTFMTRRFRRIITNDEGETSRKYGFQWIPIGYWCNTCRILYEDRQWRAKPSQSYRTFPHLELIPQKIART